MRIPGPLGIVLSHSPLAPLPKAGVGPSSQKGGASQGRLIAKATAYAKHGTATKEFHCRRGDVVTLDASGSSPNALAFEWSLVVEKVPVVQTGGIYTPENPPPVRRVEGKKAGKRITVLALASFDATLVVKDGVSESPPCSVSVRVESRVWKTHYDPKETTLKEFAKFYGAPPAERHAGSNVCSLCGMADGPVGHYIHHGKDQNDWKKQFSVKRVDESGSPFHGLWYVEKVDLRIERSLYINSELTTGQVFQLNKKNRAYAEALKARVECTKLHEKIHGELLAKKLKEPGMDPAPLVELLIGEDEDSLANQANTEIAIKEDFLANATTGHDGHAVLRERLKTELKNKTTVTFLLPKSKKKKDEKGVEFVTDEKGVEFVTDLLSFDDD